MQTFHKHPPRIVRVPHNHAQCCTCSPPTIKDALNGFRRLELTEAQMDGAVASHPSSSWNRINSAPKVATFNPSCIVLIHAYLLQGKSAPLQRKALHFFLFLFTLLPFFHSN